MNPFLIPTLTFIIGVNMGVLIMSMLSANARYELERREQAIKAQLKILETPFRTPPLWTYQSPEKIGKTQLELVKQ